MMFTKLKNGLYKNIRDEVTFDMQAAAILVVSWIWGTTIVRSVLRIEKWGESFTFCINEVSVFAMGANYISEDSVYPWCSEERSRKLIEQCVKANYNSIRVWGGGYFCEDD